MKCILREVITDLCEDVKCRYENISFTVFTVAAMTPFHKVRMKIDLGAK